MAALRGHKEVVELLLSHGAEVDATDNRGMTALQSAEQKGRDDIVELLRLYKSMKSRLKC